MTTQRASWVIEWQLGSGSLYFCGSFCLGSNHSAIRFSRKEDAERTMNYLLANNLLVKAVKPTVAEHIWIGE